MIAERQVVPSLHTHKVKSVDYKKGVTCDFAVDKSKRSLKGCASPPSRVEILILALITYAVKKGLLVRSEDKTHSRYRPGKLRTREG